MSFEKLTGKAETDRKDNKKYPGSPEIREVYKNAKAYQRGGFVSEDFLHYCTLQGVSDHLYYKDSLVFRVKQR